MTRQGAAGVDTPVPELSIVVPTFNEEENVVAMHEALVAEAEQHVDSFEIIFIDNASSDRTRELLRQICARDPRVRAIFNTRNYGQMRSPTYGLFQAEGRAVIGMCCDFQDPPALIGEFVRQWRAGAQIVLGQRRTEQASPLLSALRRIGYALFNRLGDYALVPGATGFGLFERTVLDMLASWNEPEPFFRGMLIESGFRTAVVPYNRPARERGTTSNTFWVLLNFALSGIGGSAKSLLRMQLVIAILMSLLAILLGIGTVIRFIVVGYSPALLLLSVMFGLFALVLLFLGLIGDQVRLLSERLRNVPLVIEDERLNFPPDRALPAPRVVSRNRLPDKP